MKKVYLKNFGCQMNIRDSEFVMGMLLEHGFRAAKSMEDADVVLFNSCSVRKHAEDRLFSNISDLKPLKKKRPDLVIGLIGCTAQNYKDKIFEKLPIVDFACGPGNETDLPYLIEDILKNRCPIVAADKVDKKRPEIFPKYREDSVKAYVSISEGCDNFCSYCIVPYVRGRERSRDSKDIIKEVRDLARRGFKEVTLLGQNVNSYMSGKTRAFIKLLEDVNRVEGIRRIRFMTSHPKDASMELFKAMRDLENVCEHLHLPLQSGSDRILKLMNRGYTRGKYLKLVENYKKILPQGALTTDIIVGYPTETEEDFVDTCDLMKKVRFDSAYLFKYSPRPHTAAARLTDDVPKDEKERRHSILLNFQKGLARQKGRILPPVLVACLFLLGPCLSYADFETVKRSGVSLDIGSAERSFLEGRYEKAAYEAQRLIDSGSRRKDELYYIKGLSEMKTGRFKDARDTFEAMVSRYPDSKRQFDAYTGIGDTYFLEGNINGAIRIYNDILDKYPKDGNIGVVYYKMGECYTRIGSNDKAKYYLDKARAISPLSFETRPSAAAALSRDTAFQPREMPRGAETGCWSVQVGSFKNKKNANRLARKLSGKGYKSYVETPAGSGDKLYRVKVGTFKSKEEAEGMASRLKVDGYRNKICTEPASSS